MKFILMFVLLCSRFSLFICSVGDRSIVYQKCLNACIKENCSKGGTAFKSIAKLKQDLWSSILQWSCRDECCYHCMWHTVKRFEEAGEETPKFHGKWPFIKVLGVQEPASVVFSLLNLAANAHMYRKIRREFPWRTSALVQFWHLFAIVCMNAWVWSTIFHTRDKPFTEFMDYACALSMVMGLFIAAIVRVFHGRVKIIAAALAVPLFYFITHVQYLYDGRIDYDYNMKVNVFFGVVGSLVWLYVASRVRRHAWRVAVFVLASGAALVLELLEFAPIVRAFDAHALWHLATAPLPLLFYRFVIDDLRFLQSRQYEKFDFKLT